MFRTMAAPEKLSENCCSVQKVVDMVDEVDTMDMVDETDEVDRGENAGCVSLLSTRPATFPANPIVSIQAPQYQECRSQAGYWERENFQTASEGEGSIEGTGGEASCVSEPAIRNERANTEPFLSFIIPVLHEGPSIVDCLEVLHELLAGSAFEIIVVDGDSEGSTIAHISRPGIETTTAPRGRGAQMNAGARIALGDILVFLHADTILPRNAPAHIRQVLRTRRYAAGAFSLRFDSSRPIYRLIEAAAWWRCRLTRIPYGDQAFFLSRSTFETLGGFAEIPLMEDMEFMRRIKARGDRIHISTRWVETSPRRWEREGIAYCIVRSWVLASLFALGVSPHRLARHYKAFSS